MSKLLIRAGLYAALMLSFIGMSACTDPVECEANSDCASDEVCTENVCEVPFIVVEQVCTDDSMCTSGNICSAGKCETGCRDSSGCNTGEACVNLSCVAVGDACESGEDCPAGLRCIDATCLECELNSQCSGGFVCQENACVACSEDSQCDSGEACVAGKCNQVNSQCGNEGESCVEGAPTRLGFVCAKFEGDDGFTCHSACQERTTCTPGYNNIPRPVGCNDTSECGPMQRCSSGLQGRNCTDLPTCNSNDDCSSVANTTCVAGQCAFACNQDSECNTGGICKDGACTGCSNDGDCANGQFCGDGACVDPTYLYLDGEACPLGELCDEDTTGNRACRRSECEGPIRGQPTCDAIAAANPDAYPNGAVCAPRVTFEVDRIPRGVEDPETPTYDEEGNYRNFAQEAFFCEPAGLQQRGDTCGIARVGDNEPYPACAKGLTCSRELEGTNLDTQFEFWEKAFNLVIGGQTNVSGICQQPCQYDSQCGVGEACIGESRGQANGLGFCGVPCEPYTLLPKDACPEGTTCRAISPTDGWCGEFVLTVEQGGMPQDVPFIPPVGDSFAYGPCPNGDEDCPHNSRCLNLGAPRCVPQCDPTRPNQEVSNATCPGGDPDVYYKLIHLAQGAPAVDIYVDGARVADDVEFDTLVDDGGEWFTTKPGAHIIKVVLGTDENDLRPLLVVDFEGEANTSTFLTVLPDPSSADGVVVRQFTDARVAPEAAEAAAALRIAHAIPGAGNVDVVGVTAGGSVEDPMAVTVLAQGLPEDGLTNYLDVPAGDYDVYIFPEGSPRTDLTATAIITDVTVTEGAQGTLFAFGAAGAQPRTPGAFQTTHQRFLYIPGRSGYCFDLNQSISNGTTASSGICLQRCDTARDFIDSPCENPGVDQCDFFADDAGVCFVRTGKSQSGSCETADDCGADQACNDEGQCVTFCEPGEECCLSNDECGIGYFCDSRGVDDSDPMAPADNPGVCRAYCSTTGDPAFPSCGADEACMPSEDIEGLGECRIPCTPDAPGVFKDSSCPAFQQTCRPVDGNYYCQESGNGAIGDLCSGTSGALCEAGALCARDIKLYETNFSGLLEPFLTENSYEDRICTQICRPFLPFGQNDCAEGFACSPIMPTQDVQTQSGICQPAIDLSADPSPEDCAGEDIGKMCGNGAYCTASDLTEDPEAGVCSATASCLYLCDPATKTGCPTDMECQGLGSVDFPSFFIGAFGICRDR